ncbi:MAG: dTDP-4-dehydrorhamnose reductase [Deltaproteobacteria bacterium]|nr:dTDP-4-dehydrorhamnose reductase [Deltaproteobacteria bacterium]
MTDFPVPCLVTGASGMLGRDLCRALTQAGIHIIEMDVEEIDISSLSSVLEVFNTVKPKVVINVAAITDVDGCESTEDLAFSVNAVGPENLAKAAADSGSFLVHISTDYVFDGTKTEPYQEDDPTNPIGVYGKSKLEGEIRLQKTLPKNHCIIRTQWLYGAHGKNFVDTIIRAGAGSKTLRIVNDQRGAPTYTVDLSEAIIKLCQLKATGVFNVTNCGSTTWSDFAAKILKLSGLNEVQIQEISTQELGRPAPRPLYSVLDNSKFERLMGTRLRRWEDALDEYLSKRNIK